MRKETKQFPNLETSWALFGYLLPDGSIYLAGYIPPLAGCIVREYASAILGGPRLNDAVDWLWSHSAMLNPGSNAQFLELYKGHSHHQLGLTRFSGQDDISIVAFVRDNPGIKAAIGPLSIIRSASLAAPTAECAVAIRLYFYSREMFDAGLREPVACEQFEVVEDVPGIQVPELGWHFIGEQEYLRQLASLRACGYQVQVLENAPPIVSWYIRKPRFWNNEYIVLHIPLGFPAVPAEVDVLRPRLHKTVPSADFLPLIQQLDREVLTHAALSGTGAA